jgi:hypothetical protein
VSRSAPRPAARRTGFSTNGITSSHALGVSDRRIAEALRGVRIGFLTDIHRSQTVSHEMVADAVNLLMAERPDLIVLGGTTCPRRSPVRASRADALAPLSAPAASSRSSAITTTTRTCRRRSRRRVHRAEGRAHRITVRGEPIDFAGVRYWTRRSSISRT